MCVLGISGAADKCVNGFPDLDLIITKASQNTDGARLMEGVLLLNAFTCSGTLTGLVLGVDVRTARRTETATRTAPRNQYPEIALWRPVDPETLEGEYNVVTGSKRIVFITPDNFSTSGVFEYALDVSLDFQANDILGWTQPENHRSVVRMYKIDGTSFMITGTIPESIQPNGEFTLASSKSSKEVLLLYPIFGKGDVQLYNTHTHTHIHTHSYF